MTSSINEKIKEQIKAKKLQEKISVLEEQVSVLEENKEK